MRWSWTSGETPLLSPTHHHEQHGGLQWSHQVPGHHHLPGPEVGQSHRLIVRKAQQRLYFLRQLRKFNLPQELLKQFYSAIIESVLCTSITVWFSSATKSDLRRLRRVVRTAERIIDTTLPTLQELYLSRVSKRAGKSLWTPHIRTLPLWTVTVWSTLQSSEHQNDQTQEQFLPSGNQSHEHLTLNVEHTTLFTLFIHHTYLFFHFNFAHVRPVHT